MTAITMRRATLLMLCLATLAGTTLSAQTIRIVMDDGSAYSGVVESETADTITIRTATDVRMSVPRTAIRSVKYDREGEGSGGGFVGFGFTGGTPGILNGVIQIQPVRLWGIRLSGGAYMLRGGEIDGVLRFAGTGRKDHNLIIGVGIMDIPDFGPGETWQATFFHVGYSYHNKGFNLMVTFGSGSGEQIDGADRVERTTPILNWQIGFVPRAYFGEL